LTRRNAWWGCFCAALNRVVNPKHRLIDNPNITLERARELDPEIPEYAWRITANFTPWSISKAQWTAVRALVAEVVVRIRPHTPDAARRVNNIVAGFVAFCWSTLGTELTIEAIFTSTNVNRYLATERMRRASDVRRWDVSRQLSKIARVLVGLEIPRTKPVASKFSGRVVTESELATMYAWATSLSTPRRRRNACAILALSAGAGMTAAEVAAARIEHVRSHGELLLVDVQGKRARTVPVMAQWARMLKLAIGDRRTGLLFDAYRIDEYPPRSVQSFLSANPAPVRPSIRDLRRSWVLSQIERGLPQRVLLHICGFNSVTAIESYLGYLPQTPAAESFYETIAMRGVAR
jgi:Phage integrase family.